LAITSGKGGVGKSSLALGLSLCLQKLGRSVTLMDMDLGLANLDIMCGVSARGTLADVLYRGRSIDEVVVPGPLGVRLVPGANGLGQLTRLDQRSRTRLLEQLRTLEDSSDIIILDTGAGVSDNVLTFCRAADEVVVISTPEPTSVTDAYATIKLVASTGQYPPIGLVMNMVRTPDDLLRVGRIIPVARKYHDIRVRNLGTVPHDDVVGRALVLRDPFVRRFPESHAALATMALARTVATGSKPVVTLPRESFFRRALGLLTGRAHRKVE
ncbi:MAG: MinD/ParA family protein, partial [Planctomycetota bacterium]